MHYLPYPSLSIFSLRLNYPTIFIHFFNQIKGRQNGSSSKCKNWKGDMFSRAISNKTVMTRTLDEETWTNKRRKECSPPTEPKCNVHWVSNWAVYFSILQKALGLEFARFWIVPFVVRHRPREWSLRNKLRSIFSGGIQRKRSPLVGDHNRVGRDMIAIVKIIAGRLMRDALMKQGWTTCSYVRNKQSLPNGFVGFHL